MSRIADARLLIGAPRRRFERAESPQVPLAKIVGLRAPTYPPQKHGPDVEVAGTLRRGQHQGAGAVGFGRDFQFPERMSDNRRTEDLIDFDGADSVQKRIAGTLGAVLHRYAGGRIFRTAGYLWR